MITITCSSLSGGMGKTTLAYTLGRKLTEHGYKVLWVDADPQASLTFYSGHDIQPNEPTLLEVLRKNVAVEDGIYELAFENLWIIPADDALDKVQDHLATSGMGAVLMGKRLAPIQKLFDLCIIDAPPQRSQLCLTALGAANLVLIPAEASSKGVNSLERTLALISEMREVGAFNGNVLGVVPFRDRWFGNNQSSRSRDAITLMEQIGGGNPILPSILESEQFKKALDTGILPTQLGHPQLEHSFNTIISLLEEQWLKMPSHV
jgi:chromosome partitioning protein